MRYLAKAIRNFAKRNSKNKLSMSFVGVFCVYEDLEPVAEFYVANGPRGQLLEFVDNLQRCLLQDALHDNPNRYVHCISSSAVPKDWCDKIDWGYEPEMNPYGD